MRSERCVRIPRLALLALAIVGAVIGLTPRPANAETWRPPVDAPVVDPFRPPATRFGAGNRGLEYGTNGGEAVRAVDGGRVTFAGKVGRHSFVTIEHGNGLRSTVGFLERVLVVRGQQIQAGQRIAVAGPGFHLTARLGGVYVDPALLFAGADVSVHLIDNPSPTRQTRSYGGGLRHVDSSLWDSFRAIVDAGLDLRPSEQFAALADAVAAWHHQECTPDGGGGAGPPAHGRNLIQVGGLGTNSEGASIGALDVESLGYDVCDIVGFSYEGGVTPHPFGAAPVGGAAAAQVEPDSLTAIAAATVGATTYGPEATFVDLNTSAQRLADLIEAVADARPGESIDIAAHSLGGVVTRLALEELARRRPAGVPINVVITIGSPHGGADLATAAEATAGSIVADVFLDPHLPEEGLREAVSVQQVAETGPHALAPPSAVPEGIRVVAVAGSNDLVVPGEKAVWPGAVNVVVDGDLRGAGSAHGGLPGVAEVTREFGLALRGLPPRCQDLRSVLGSAIEARGVTAGEDLVTVVAGFIP